jgi:hypothetical protein
MDISKKSEFSINEQQRRSKVLKRFFNIKKQAQNSGAKPGFRLNFINEEIMPRLPEVLSIQGIEAEESRNVSENLADMIRGISLDAFRVNEHHTCKRAHELARQLAITEVLKEQIEADYQKFRTNPYFPVPASERRNIRVDLGTHSINLGMQPKMFDEIFKDTTKKPKSGCLSLLLISSLVVAPVIYSIINQTT